MYRKEAESSKAPIYGSFELSPFAEETILNPGNRNNMTQPRQQIIKTPQVKHDGTP
jgi:hypothetical protein